VRQNVVEKLLRVCVNISVYCYLFTTVKVVSFYHLVNLCHIDCSDQSTVWVKKSSLRFSDIFSKQLGFFNQFLHLLYVPFYTGWQIFIHLFPTLTELCHTKCDHPANFFHFTRTTSKLAYWANDVTIDVLSYPTCLLTYKSVYFIVGGTMVAVPPPFRPGEPALCGSCPLVTPY